jgi:hypothetical protein
MVLVSGIFSKHERVVSISKRKKKNNKPTNTVHYNNKKLGRDPTRPYQLMQKE